MKNNDALRRTGRTTRMLQEAIRLASQENRAVYVMMADLAQVNAFVGTIPQGLGIQFETIYTLPNFNWETLTLPGAHPRCVVLVDHHAIEARFGKMLRELHHYDKAD